MMTDDELAEFIGVKGKRGAAAIMAAVTPAQRATFEQMARTERELEAWTQGRGPKPAGVVVCRRRGR